MDESRYAWVEQPGGGRLLVRRVAGGQTDAPPSDLISSPRPGRGFWSVLEERPNRAIPIAATSASRQLLTGPAIFAGWALRDTVGVGTIVEFIDGADATGVIVAESVIQTATGTQPVNTDTDVDASSATAASANNVTLPGVAGQTTFITGFEITGDGATGTSIITITVTGILGGTKTYFLTIPAGVGTSITPLIVEYSRPIPASGTNVGIVVNVPSFGAGNTNAAVTAHGFQRNSLGGSIAPIALQDRQILGPEGPFCERGIFMRVVQGTITGAIWARY